MNEPPLDAPDEEWLVWADAMQQRGDPRGELIALAKFPEKRDAYVKRHADALLGRVAGRHVRKGNYRVTWQRCHVDTIEVRIDNADDGPQLVIDALGVPMRGLAVAGVASPYGEGLDLRKTIGWLRESHIPPTLTKLALIDDRARVVDHLVSRDMAAPPNLVTFGPLVELWRAFAHLEELTIVVADPGQVQFGPIRLPALRSFTLHALTWVEGLGQMLANARWPQLQSLALRLCDGVMMNDPDDSRAYRGIYGYDRARGMEIGNPLPSPWRDDLPPLFDALRELPIERLALTSCRDVGAILDLLDEAQLPLKELDLSDSAFDHAERIARTPWALRLERLVIERVTAKRPPVLPGEVVHSCSPTAPTYRFIVGME